MATRHPAPQAARRPSRRAHANQHKLLYRRPLRYEPLEDRQLLALVTVDTPLDTVDLEDDLTSLREAIFATNLVSGRDEITFDFGHDGPETIVLTKGELRITGDLTINGPGAELLTIDATGNDPTPGENSGDGSRVFNVDNGDPQLFINVTIRGLTLTGGDVLVGGGAIRSREHFTLRDSVVSGSAAVSADPLILSYGGGIAHSDGLLAITGSIITENFGDFGGGIHVDGGQAFLASTSITANVGQSGAGIYNDGGVAFISRSTIRDNSAGAFSLGGGIYSSGNLSVFDTTISGNSADYGGGVFSRTETVGDNETLIVNSTISGNTAFSRGGGVRNAYGRTTIQFSTITGNTAPPGEGSGVASRGYTSATTRVSHTIIAGNTNSDVDFGTGTVNTFVSRGYNLIGTGNAAAAFQGPGDQTGVANPLLGPLADNGGFILPDGSRILTHALLPGSPAINRGDLNAKAGEGGIPTYDQRLEPFSRVVNGRIDVGAFEYQSPSDLNLVVDTLADESDGNHGRNDLSLREAIELANLYPSDDTIRFDPALTAAGPATILLTKGELRITDDVSIEGPSAEFLTIDASGNDPTPEIDDGRGSRVFNIDDGLRNSRIDVSISGLTLSGGDVSNVGGGIRSLENVAVLESIISGNASGPFGQGGGIYSDIGNLTIIDSQVLNNRAGFGGGGLYIRNGEASIIGSTIAGNVILGLQRTGIGVGIHSRNANLAIANSTISGNSGIGNAGLYAISAGRIEISNSQFLDNYYGVAIFSAEGTIDIRGSNVAQNDLHGVRLRIVDHVNVSITDTSVSDNLGGGIYAEENDGALAIVDCVVSGNGAGGIFAESSLNGVVEISNSTIAGNTTPFSGAGVDLRGGTVTIARSSIYDNVARGRDLGGYGGGGIHSNFAKVTISDSSIHNNSSQFPGGGISARGNLAVIRSQVTGNTATREGGGIWSRGYALIDRTTIANNSADYGGGIRGGELTITDSNIVRNSAHGLERLWPNSGNGGGVFGTGLIAIANSLIDGNSAAHHGGGIRAFLTGTTVSNSTVSNNSAEEGGGVFGPAVISQSTISSNTAEVGAGLHTGYARVTNSTISFNRAEILGAGIFITANSLTLDHSIVASNIGPYNGIVGLLGAIINARYSVIGNALGSGLAEAPAGSPDANGNLIGGPVHGPINPRLGPLAYNGGATPTHALLSGSPAIDAGDPAAMAGVGGVPQFDQRGEPFTRVYGGRIDIGAFEAQPNPLTGDYNFNGVVDTADVVIWRKTRNRSGDLRADGNGDGVVNDADWQVWRENFGRTAESEEQGAGSVEQEAVAAPPQRPAWQPPASPGVSVAAPRAAFRPATQWFAPDDELLASVAMPLARWQGRKEFIPARRQLTGDTIDAASDPSVGVIDRVFETLGADLAGSRPSVARRLLAQT